MRQPSVALDTLDWLTYGRLRPASLAMISDADLMHSTLKANKNDK